jgi:NTE family protein
VILSEAARPAIAASMALPALFSPVTIDGRMFMDGGLVNPLPFDVVKGDADITVAIDVSGAPIPARQASATVGPFSALMSSHADPAALDHPREAQSPAARYLHRRRGRRILRARLPPLQEVLAAAAPDKEHLKRQLARILASHTTEALPAVVASEPPPHSPPRKRRLPSLKRLTRAGKA